MPNYANPFQNPNLMGQIQNLDYLEQMPEAGWGLFTNNFMAPYSAQSWLRNQYNQFYRGYAGQQAIDPTTKWVDFLASQNIGRLYGSASPYERGERGTLYAPRMRYIGSR